MEKEDVLLADKEIPESASEEEDEEDGIWDKMFGGGGKRKKDKKQKQAALADSQHRGEVVGAEDAKVQGLRGGDVINVFTVASGHMYERLQKIMFLSVVKNTRR
jgi:UDP-glucose:glycoprotein glucosyltransferase